MSEFKGTPGPWKVNVIGQHWNNKSLTHLEVTFGNDGECVCDTVYQMADANLIAAAPELLEALLDLKFKLYGSETASPKIEQIIKKALGQQQL